MHSHTNTLTQNYTHIHTITHTQAHTYTNLHIYEYNIVPSSKGMVIHFTHEGCSYVVSQWPSVQQSIMAQCSQWTTFSIPTAGGNIISTLSEILPH